MKILHGTFALAASLLLAAGVVAQEAPRSEELIGSFETAFNAGNAGDLMALFAEDAVAMPPDGDVLEGRSAIEAYFTESFEQAAPSGLDVTSREMRQLGEAYVDTGTYTMSASGPDGQARPINGDYMTVIEQNDAGEWQISRHIWNQDLPAE